MVMRIVVRSGNLPWRAFTSLAQLSLNVERSLSNLFDCGGVWAKHTIRNLRKVVFLLPRPLKRRINGRYNIIMIVI